MTNVFGSNRNEKKPILEITEEDKSNLRIFYPQLIFRNALQGFLREQSRSLGYGEKKSIYAVDALEVYAWVNPQEHHIKSFSFGDLMSASGSPSELELKNHSDLVGEQLFFGNPDPYVIFDSHIEECEALFSLIRTQVIRIEEANKAIANSSDLDTIQSLYAGVSDIFKQDNQHLNKSQISDVNQILSLWSELFSDQYLNFSAVAGRIDAFARNSQYLSIFGSSNKFFNSKQIRAHSNLVDHDAFEHHLRLPQVQNNIFLSKHRLKKLLESVSEEDRRSKGGVELAIERDVEALCLAQCINDFLASCRIPIRLEFVTRSFRLHLAAFLLTHEELRVSIRHPMLIPGIHSFHPTALNNLKEISQEVEHCLGTLLRLASGNKDAEPKMNKSVQSDFLERFNELASTAVSQIVDMAVSQRTSEKLTPKKRDGETEAIIQRVSNFVLDDIKRDDGNFEQRITDFISEKVLLSTGIFRSKTGRPKSNIHTPFFEGKRLRVIVNIFRADPFFDIDDLEVPRQAVSVRIMDRRLPRLFLFHGERFKDFMLNEALKKLGTGAERIIAKDPIELDMDAEQFFKFVNSGRIGLPEADPDLDDLEVILAQSILYASFGWYSVASTLISQFTRPVTAVLRRKLPLKFGHQIEIFSDDLDPGVVLAYKELFLLRHYCERSEVIQSLYDNESNGFNSGIGSATRNVARAQRDLDLAVYMSEEYFRLLRAKIQLRHMVPSSRENHVSMKNVHHYRQLQRSAFDARLGLVHTASWLELFVWRRKRERMSNTRIADLMRNSVGEAESSASQFFPNTLNDFEQQHMDELFESRYETWMSAGIVKQLEIENKRVGIERLALESAGTSFSRETRLWAYLEAHGMSTLSLSFIVACIFDGFPGIGAIWSPWNRVSYDQFLVFRGWREWSNRLSNLNEHYSLEIRSTKFIDSFCSLFVRIDNLRGHVARSRLESPEKISDFHNSFARLLDDFEISLHSLYGENPLEQGLLNLVKDDAFTKINNLKKYPREKIIF